MRHDTLVGSSTVKSLLSAKSRAGTWALTSMAESGFSLMRPPRADRWLTCAA